MADPKERYPAGKWTYVPGSGAGEQARGRQGSEHYAPVEASAEEKSTMSEEDKLRDDKRALISGY